MPVCYYSRENNNNVNYLFFNMNCLFLFIICDASSGRYWELSQHTRD